MMTREQAEEILRKRFHFNKFYDLQWETIQRILKGERVLLIEKTGYGKSLCFQYPAILFKGVTIVFSPLIALMRDQVKKLQSLEIPAKCINSNQSDEENQDIIEEAKQNKIKILYIAPERQENSFWIQEIRNIKISMVVVDEAHCISMWGHDFRPAYKKIVDIVNLLPQNTPVLAITATANKRVENDIQTQLSGNMTVIRGNLLRPKLKLYVINVKSDDEKLIWLGKKINTLEGTGIVYTGTVANTIIISDWLNFLNISATYYNGKAKPEERLAIEKGFMNNEWKCVVATNALGMGIDKPDIRFIIHTQFPQSPIHYYQEIGRAGRDGNPAVIILLYNPEDRALEESFIENSKPSLYYYNKVIEVLKNESLGERQIINKCNINKEQFRAIKADLLSQGIIREIQSRHSKQYEFVPHSKPFDPSFIEELRDFKRSELQAMINYAECKTSRMKFLCEYLGDDSKIEYNNCDNTNLAKHYVNINEEWKHKLNQFYSSYYPVLEVESNNSNLVNGVAASYYGFSDVGKTIHKCKYENGGDFPDYLINLMLKAYKSKFSNMRFDLIMYIPPTVSRDLVKNLAHKVAIKLNIPITDALQKTHNTKEQKSFNNYWLKQDNVRNAFILKDKNIVKGKKILLIDDIFDSGATIKEAGRFLTQCGASAIAPLVIAKTLKGDKIK